MKLRKSTDFLVIHCSDTPPSMDIGVPEIRKWHTEERGWDDIGYHFVIRRDGRVEAGRELAVVGAHVHGYNSRSIGVCLVGGKAEGGKPSFNFSAVQMIALGALMRVLVAVYPAAKVRGHRDFTDVKTCPQFDAREWAARHGLPN